MIIVSPEKFTVLIITVAILKPDATIILQFDAIIY